MTYVLDASVAAKWFLPAEAEPLAAEAHSILKQFAKAECRLLVPDLFWAELGNILWKAVRSIYVALALARNVPLLTADERLANSWGARFPVRWLGGLSL